MGRRSKKKRKTRRDVADQNNADPNSRPSDSSSLSPSDRNNLEPAHVLPPLATDRPTQLAALALYLIANLTAPFVIGEVYPFTMCPLFSDQPEQYTLYRVEDEDGNVLPEKNYGLHLNYDGNPPGLGAGIAPPPTINRHNAIESEEKVRQYVSLRMKQKRRRVLIVEQQIYGSTDSQRVGLTGTNRWRIELPR